MSFLALLLVPFLVVAQSIADNDGYTGYHLGIRDDGDPTAVLYQTENTGNNVSALVPEPDVFLNASVHVGEINIEVDNVGDGIILQLVLSANRRSAHCEN